MRFVFIMDPTNTIIVNEDTTFALMLEAQNLGHQVFYCQPNHLFLKEESLFAKAQNATLKRDPNEPALLDDEEMINLAEVDAVWIRKDPPFDPPYLWLTLLAEKLRGQTLVLNDPRGLRDANEKLYAAIHFPALMPKTLVSCNKEQILTFTKEMGGKAVIKPIDGHGGGGVFLLNLQDPNKNAIIEALTQNFSLPTMVQQFLPEVTEGDKRILLLNGEPLGAILRVPQNGDVRSNIHVGGSVVQATLDEYDKHIIQTIAPQLQKDGLYFVGLDVIGGKLTEVNVTSPTGIQQMSRLDHKNYAAQTIEWAAKKALNF